jgi:glutaconate CoA-transferase subunit A
MAPTALSIEQAVAQVADGATVALGGIRLQRRPMSLVRALADAGRRELTVIAFLGSLDVELLLAAGCVAELHAPSVGLDAAGLAPRFRAARQAGGVRFVEWSEGLLLTSLEAAARGVPSHPAWMGLGSDLPSMNPWLAQGVDPFDATPVMNVRALRVDVALLHVPEADAEGNLYVGGDLGADGLIARASRRTLAGYERACPRDPPRAAISRLWVDGLVEAPRGAWPCGCHPDYRADLNVARRWASDSTSTEILTP